MMKPIGIHSVLPRFSARKANELNPDLVARVMKTRVAPLGEVPCGAFTFDSERSGQLIPVSPDRFVVYLPGGPDSFTLVGTDGVIRKTVDSRHQPVEDAGLKSRITGFLSRLARPDVSVNFVTGGGYHNYTMSFIRMFGANHPGELP